MPYSTKKNDHTMFTQISRKNNIFRTRREIFFGGRRECQYRDPRVPADVHRRQTHAGGMIVERAALKEVYSVGLRH